MVGGDTGKVEPGKRGPTPGKTDPISPSKTTVSPLHRASVCAIVGVLRRGSQLALVRRGSIPNREAG